MPHYFWILVIIVSALIGTLLFWSFRKKVFLFSFLIIAFLGISVGLYSYWGSSQALEQYYENQKKEQQVHKVLARYKNTAEIIEAMKKAITKNPEKAKGWYLLGRLYRADKNYPEAVSAFEKAYTLEPNNTNYAFEYLQSLYVTNNQQHTPLIQILITQLKEVASNNPAILDFLGYDAYIHGNNEEAIQYWEALLPYLENDPKSKKAILKAIGKAQKKLVK